jgi:polyribonucleotide nucleotidyltransferase
MKNTTSVSIELGTKTITMETGLLARQAQGSVTVTQGESMLFSAVTAAKKPREGCDFFPMQVEYREKFYAAGRFPGGFFKREARPSEKEILTARLTDRPIRPLFPKAYQNELQINNAVLCADGQNEPDVLSIVAASAALTLSELPFMGPIAAVRVGRVDGEFVVNPTHEEQTKSDLDLIYAGSRDLPLMIEGSGAEIPEADLLAAMKFAHAFVVKLVDAQLELRAKMGLPEKVVEDPESPYAVLADRMRELKGDELKNLLAVADKQGRDAQVSVLREELKAALTEEEAEMKDEAFFQAFDLFETAMVRSLALDDGKRIGGRAFDELRHLDVQVGLLPRAHGSALFSRGDTQALAAATLGTGDDAQRLDAVTGGVEKKSFLLHYNFPPYSVGEVGRLGSTNRREIGHGNLAERSLREVLPVDFPYSVRLVSEIMGSNGSSSMASVCVGSLALMDAGVPIRDAVAGISIGLISGPDKAELLTDIIGTEDHCGDMDFKVAGTRKGITGFQVDLKIRGLDWNLVEGAFARAKEARAKILDAMGAVIREPRAEMSPYAPRLEVLTIPTDKIGALIGPGGKNIRRITDTYKVQIDIEDDGTVSIFATDGESMNAAKHEVELLSAEAELNKIYHGRVTGVKDFGCFVEILPGKEGLVHISELADFRVNKTEDICKMGDPMWVKCIGIEDNGKIRLSRKAALKEKDDEAQGEKEE